MDGNTSFRKQEHNIAEAAILTAFIPLKKTGIFSMLTHIYSARGVKKGSIHIRQISRPGPLIFFLIPMDQMQRSLSKAKENRGPGIAEQNRIQEKLVRGNYFLVDKPIVQ